MDVKEIKKMGQFNSNVSAEFNPPKQWKLLKQLVYTNRDIDVESLKQVGVDVVKDSIPVHQGFKTDLASVPRACWWLLAPWDIARAAIVHDLLYWRIRLYRKNNNDKKIIKKAKKAADDVFLMGMKDADPKVSKWKIYSAYWAVRLFGRWSIIPRDDD
jgi:hypothetical protein